MLKIDCKHLTTIRTQLINRQTSTSLCNKIISMKFEIKQRAMDVHNKSFNQDAQARMFKHRKVCQALLSTQNILIV